ncbi:MAG: type IX secretion system membrane protein PorP/SprF [Bacteroidetes bacterium]|nr:type IX secretion system membrane protein PorP/SprF [Bacteroidota bacterium]
MKRIYYLLFLIILSCPFSKMSGQSEPVYSQYMFDKILINPAYAGSSNWMVGSLKYRKHFMGIEDAPETSLFTFHAPLQKKSMGVGLKAVYDQTAVTNTLSLTGVYSFHIGFGNGKLSFGLEGGMVHKLTDYNGLYRHDQDDPMISNEAVSAIVPDASFGIYFHSRDYYAGVSVFHLFNTQKTSPDYNSQMFQLERSATLMGGYIFDIKDIFTIEYGLMVRYVPEVPILTDFFMNVNFFDRITAGGAFRAWDQVSVMLKLDVTKSIRVAYSYDINLTGLSNYTSGSHELMLSYGIKLLPPATRREVHPRYYF